LKKEKKKTKEAGSKAPAQSVLMTEKCAGKKEPEEGEGEETGKRFKTFKNVTHKFRGKDQYVSRKGK